MSRMMSGLHFRPRTPRLVAIGQFLNGTMGTGGSTGVLAMAIPGSLRGWDSARLKEDGRTACDRKRSTPTSRQRSHDSPLGLAGKTIVSPISPRYRLKYGQG